MEEMGFFRKFKKPTDWCHPIVLVKKENGSSRPCLDHTHLNSAVKQEFYQLESVDKLWPNSVNVKSLPSLMQTRAIGKCLWRMKAN